MISRLLAEGVERIFDGEIGRFVEASVIPCHRCGVCCERWQPLVSADERARLARFLDLSPMQFAHEFTTAYPFDDQLRLLRRVERGCVFLAYEAGRSNCTVHPARPDSCRDWTASLERRECVDGLQRFDGVGGPAQIIPLVAVYPEREERAAFVRVIRGTEGEDDG